MSLKSAKIRSASILVKPTTASKFRELMAPFSEAFCNLKFSAKASEQIKLYKAAYTNMSLK